jgi:hypothetical protein
MRVYIKIVLNQQNQYVDPKVQHDQTNQNQTSVSGRQLRQASKHAQQQSRQAKNEPAANQQNQTIPNREINQRLKPQHA